MPRWTAEDLTAYYERKRNQAGGAKEGSKPERSVQDEPVATAAREAQYAGRVRVCITGFRRRLLDPCNFCTKYIVDCLRYAEIIQDDRYEDIILQVQQVKVKTKAEERTVIEIEPL